MVAGYLAGRFRILNSESSEALNRFVFVVALPALVFVSLSRVSVAEFFDWSFLGALGGGMLATFCLGFVIARMVFPGSLTALGLHGLTGMYSSTGYIGLPLLLSIFGDRALAPGVVGVTVTGAVFLPIGIILAEFDKSREAGDISFAPLLGVLRTPVFLATISGLGFSALGIEIPLPVVKFFDLLGGAFVPCALFSVGIFLVDCSLGGDKREIGWLVFVKLVLHPLITWWLAYQVLDMEGMLPAAAVLLAALPSGVPVFVLAQQYDTFAARSNAVIVLSTALSVFTLSGLLVILEL